MHYYNEEVMSFSDICTITKDVITYSAQPNFVAFFLIRKNDSTQKTITFPSVDKNHIFACKLPLEHKLTTYVGLQTDNQMIVLLVYLLTCILYFAH